MPIGVGVLRIVPPLHPDVACPLLSAAAQYHILRKRDRTAYIGEMAIVEGAGIGPDILAAQHAYLPPILLPRVDAFPDALLGIIRIYRDFLNHKEFSLLIVPTPEPRLTSKTAL